MAQQLKHELATIAWPGGSGEVVFGASSVHVYAGAAAETALPPGFPFALVTIDSGTPDDDDPDLLEQLFGVLAVVEVAGDELGEFAIIGSSRSDTGKSAGAGVAEVAERVRAAAQRLTAYDGAATIVSAAGVGGTQALGRVRNVAMAEFTVRAQCTSAPAYSAPQQLRVAGGTWRWAGDWCAARFDFLHFALGYVNGAEPVATLAELDGIIYTGTNLETAFAPAPGRVYQLFACYNGHGGAGVTASSEAERGTFVAT